MTLREAKKLAIGTMLHHKWHKNADGTPERWRVTGAVKRWKGDKDRIKVPIKYGLCSYGYLTNENYKFFSLEEETRL